MQIISNPFPLRPTTEDARPATEISKVVQFLAEAAQALAVQDADGSIDCAADLTLRALAAAAASGRFHGGTEVDGVLTVLGDTIHTYTDTARAYLDPSFAGNRPDLHDRATALWAAVDQLTEIARAMEAEFQGVIKVRATWSPGSTVEVFDYEDHPMGTYVPLVPPATPADTTEEATRQLAERGFVVVGDWEKSTGKIFDAEFEEHHAALRFTLTF
ncbi:hypothetical protein IU501_33055 [Nocardia otitidiscaviarum]|uniref:hypothetical protein n=1 Tax=Nocardia otitidiscaviarum TaxID=1823 RepID=UPI0004A75D63|nr:hypothetical protein [Nocardia otitidiscaviarum]MBF6137802.1 hypothetical protein [Nocardia otitidiscaviarum]MBF6485325.1 hypothetical protein [Nocardia otitidiscaviarum]